MKLQHLFESYANPPAHIETSYSNHLDLIFDYYKSKGVLPPMIYRGSKNFERALVNGDDEWVTFKGWEGGGRKPLDSSDYIHHKVDEALERITGYKLRSSSVFVTNDYDQASGYGLPGCVLFSNQNFQFFWLKNVRDLMLQVTDTSYSDEESLKNIEQRIRTEWPVQRANTIRDVLDKFATLKTPHEGYLVCQEYAMVNYHTLISYCERRLLSKNKE